MNKLRFAVILIIVGISLLTIFKLIYPHTDITKVAIFVTLVSIVLTSLIEIVISKNKNRGEDNEKEE